MIISKIANFFFISQKTLSLLETDNSNSTVTITSSDIFVDTPIFTVPPSLNDPNDWSAFNLGTKYYLTGLYSQIENLNNTRLTIFNDIKNKYDQVLSLYRTTTYEYVQNKFLNGTGNFYSIPAYEKQFFQTNSLLDTDLEVDLEENCLRLKRISSLSTIKTDYYFSGKVRLEKSTGQPTNDNIYKIVDGKLSSTWDGSVESLAPIKTNLINHSWLPEAKANSGAILVTFDFYKSTIISELFLDPSTKDGYDLYQVSWHPNTDINVLVNGDMEYSNLQVIAGGTHGNLTFDATAHTITGTSGSWITDGFAVAQTITVFGTPGGVNDGTWVVAGRTALVLTLTGGPNVTAAAYTSAVTIKGWVKSAGATFNAGSGYGATQSLRIVETGGTAYQDIDLATAVQTYVSGTGQTSTIPLLGMRTNLKFKAKGNLTTPLEVLYTWYDVSSNIINIERQKFSIAGNWDDYEFNGFIPEDAVTLRVTYSVENQSLSNYVYIDNASLMVGEQTWVCDEFIDQPKSLFLPKVVTTKRISLLFTQVVANLDTRKVNTGIEDDLYELPRFVQVDFPRRNTSETVLKYNMGIRELDFRFSQFNLNGVVTTKTIKLDKEARRLGLTANLDKQYLGGTTFKVLPVENDDNIYFSVDPNLITVNELKTTGISNLILTEDEIDAGWTPPSTNDYVVVKPQTIVEEFAGTAIDGTLKLSYVPYINKVKIRSISDWISIYYPFKINFNPNNNIYFGLKSAVRETSIDSFRYAGLSLTTVNQEDIQTKNGYIPINITLETEGYKANQDLIGPLDLHIDSVIFDEELTEIDVSTIIKVSSYQNKTFNEWAATTTVREYLSLTQYKEVFSSADFSSILERSVQYGIENGVLNTYSNYIENDFNLINKFTNNNNSEVSTIEGSRKAYRTKFFPVTVTDSSIDMAVKVEYITSSKVIYLKQSEYTVDVRTGVLLIDTNKLNSSDPTATLTVKATYKFESKNSSVIGNNGFLISPSTSTDITISNVQNTGFPLCRNITNYDTWETPSFKKFVNDSSDSNYYPIIEYYQTLEGKVVFSREFSKFGSQKAKIKIEYESLKINPRIKIDISKSSSTTITPKIYDLTLLVD